MPHPSRLQRQCDAVLGEFDCFNYRITDGRDGRLAGSGGNTSNHHSAGPTLAYAATESCAHKLKMITQHPEQRLRRIDIYPALLPVDLEFKPHSLFLRRQGAGLYLQAGAGNR